MSETGFTPVHKLIVLGSSAAELAGRIDHGELYWRDDFGRHMRAENIEKERVLESLRVHYAMCNFSVEFEPAQITEYMMQWKKFDSHIRQGHPLVRGGFLDAGTTKLAKPFTAKDRSHFSEKLVTLNQAADIFWAHADRKDRTTHKPKANVVAWLVKRGFTESLAEKGATIIRPEWVPTGRKPEE
jgi:hypothetical protein